MPRCICFDGSQIHEGKLSPECRHVLGHCSEKCILKLSGKLETARSHDVNIGGVDHEVEVAIELEHWTLHQPESIGIEAQDAVFENSLELRCPSYCGQVPVSSVCKAREVA